LSKLVKFVIAIFLFNSFASAEKKNLAKKIPLSSVYGNFKLAKGKIIEADGDVTNILYSGQSIRFVMEKNSQNPVVIESYDPALISGARLGSSFRLCGIFLKYRKFKIKEKKINLPVLLVESSRCP